MSDTEKNSKRNWLQQPVNPCQRTIPTSKSAWRAGPLGEDHQLQTRHPRAPDSGWRRRQIPQLPLLWPDGIGRYLSHGNGRLRPGRAGRAGGPERITAAQFPRPPLERCSIQAQELYDHQYDGGESVNIDGRPEHRKLVTELARKLAVGWRGVLPPENHR